MLLIHEADPQSRPVVITVFTRVRPFPRFQNRAKHNKSSLPTLLWARRVDH